MSSLFQGALMERISTEYADELHSSGLKPYSQYIKVNDNQVTWHISALSQQASDEITIHLYHKNLKEIQISYKDTSGIIESQTLLTAPEDEWTKSLFFAKSSRFINVEFITPTAFKQGGKYVFFPSVRHIFQSLILKYNASNDTARLDVDEMLKNFENYTEISHYRLKSCRFSLEGVKIPAFMGNVTLRVNGPQQLVNLAHLLLRFGEYSGVGIKNAIGMGAVHYKSKKGESE